MDGGQHALHVGQDAVFCLVGLMMMVQSSVQRSTTSCFRMAARLADYSGSLSLSLSLLSSKSMCMHTQSLLNAARKHKNDRPCWRLL